VNVRTWISLFNLVAIVIAFVVLFELPQYSDYAFYGLLSWILVGFVLLYALRVGRSNPTTGTRSRAPGSSGGAGASALPSGSAGGPAASLDFCIYCGASLPMGSAACPACGHAARPV